MPKKNKTRNIWMTTTVIVVTHKHIETALFINRLKTAMGPDLQDIDKDIKTAADAQGKDSTNAIEIKKTINGKEFSIILIGGYTKSTPHPFASACLDDNEEVLQTATAQLLEHTDKALLDKECESLIFLCDWNLFCSGENVCTIMSLASRITSNPQFLASKANVVFGITGNGNVSPGETPSEAEQKAMEKVAAVFSPSEEKSMVNSSGCIWIKQGENKSNLEAATTAIRNILAKAELNTEKASVVNSIPNVVTEVVESVSPKSKNSPRNKTADIMAKLCVPEASTIEPTATTTPSPVQSFPSPINNKRSDSVPFVQNPAVNTPTSPSVRKC